MSTLNWDSWARGWSAAFPKNQMWGAIRSGEHDPKTGEPLYRFDDKPATGSMDPELADTLAAHRFVAPAVRDLEEYVENRDHCFCGWTGDNHGDHLAEQVGSHPGDHNAELVSETSEPRPSGEEHADDAHKATSKPGDASHNATKEPGDDAHKATKRPAAKSVKAQDDSDK